VLKEVGETGRGEEDELKDGVDDDEEVGEEEVAELGIASEFEPVKMLRRLPSKGLEAVGDCSRKVDE
jgi:hypothetical protein